MEEVAKILTPAEVAEIRARADKATPGPLEVRYGGNFTDIGQSGFNAYCDENHHSATALKIGSMYWPWGCAEDARAKAEENAEFFVAARTDVPELCASHDALTAQLAQRDKAIAELRNGAWIANVIRNIAELPDRDSPDGWPEAMLVTGGELEALVRAALTSPTEASNG